MGRSGSTLRGQRCWVFESHPDTGCPGPPAAHPALSISARCAPGSAPGHQRSVPEGGLLKAEVNTDVPGRAASLHKPPVSSQCLPEPRAGGRCMRTCVRARENTSEPATNWQKGVSRFIAASSLEIFPSLSNKSSLLPGRRRAG